MKNRPKNSVGKSVKMSRSARELERVVQDAVHEEMSMKVLLGFRMSGLVNDKVVINNDHPEGKRPQNLVSKLLKIPGKHFVLFEIDSDKFELSRFDEVSVKKSERGVFLQRGKEQFAILEETARTIPRKSKKKR